MCRFDYRLQFLSVLLLWILNSSFDTHAASEINAFVEGAVWETSGEDPDFPPFEAKYFFNGFRSINGKQYLEMYRESTRKLPGTNRKRTYKPRTYMRHIGSVREEDGKVYFVLPGKEEELLYYDFNLKPGDETVVYTGIANNPSPVKIKCVSSEEFFSGETSFRIIGVKCRGNMHGINYWIGGIGSYLCPYANIYTGYGGFNEGLDKVTINGEVIFEF